MADSVLAKQEGVALLILLCVLVPQVLERDGLLPHACDRVELQQGLVVGISELVKWPPLVWSELSDEDLPSVALSSQVDFLGVDLVGNVNQQDVEEVV